MADDYKMRQVTAKSETMLRVQEAIERGVARGKLKQSKISGSQAKAKNIVRN